MNNQKQQHNTQNSEKIDTDLSSSNLTEMTKEHYINNYANDNEDVIDEEESNDHLPRVQVELDKLNYANESINNLELELEESKKEFIRTWHESDAELTRLEKKLGASCVSKSLPYYESRIELSEAKDKYLKAKIRFETAQELYMAAKNMQVYAEETLEKASDETPGVDVGSDSDEIKLLQLAKSKVNETEQAKKTSDTELVEALAHYEAKRDKMNACEKDLKKFIEKSYKYYEFKSSQLKELKFLFTKIEGLKFCLKEAKSTYQQSLKNLESISTEIHVQRKTTSFNKSLLRQANNNNNNNNRENVRGDDAADVVVEESDSNNNTCTNRNLESPSSSTLSSSSSSSLIISETSSHPLADLLQEATTTPLPDNENASVKTLNHQQSGSVGSEEDYDLYFLNRKVDTNQENSSVSVTAPPPAPHPTPSQNNSTLPPTSNPSISVPLFSRNSVIRKSSSNSNWISNWTNSNTILSDEDVENLKLDEKLKNYKIDLENSYSNKSGAKTEIILKSEQPNIVSKTQQQQPLNAETLLSNSTSNNNDDDNETNNGDSTSQTRPQFRVPSFFNNINRK